MSLNDAAEGVQECMDEILTWFKPGAKITVLVRRPEKEDGSQDFVMTSDDLPSAIKALQIRASA